MTLRATARPSGGGLGGKKIGTRSQLLIGEEVSGVPGWAAAPTATPSNTAVVNATRVTWASDRRGAGKS